MLLELKNYWIRKWYFIEKRLWDLNEAQRDGFSHIDEIIIDFDKTWRIVWRELNLKTADALKFDNNRSLKFIEFKNITNNNNVSNFIRSLDFSLKVQESFQLLRNILNEKDFWTRAHREWFNETRNKFIFSIKSNNWDPRLEILLTMEISWLEDHDKTLEKVIWIKTEEIENYLD